MKISYHWLFEYIDISEKPTPEQVSELLTHCGLEVEGLEPFETVKGGLKGFVVGEVKTCIKHPQADKLSVTTVDVGSGNYLTIVCGASNVPMGQKVPVALVGTTLYSGDTSFEITKRALRGVPSEGMICAEDELGIGSSHEGILVLDPTAVVGTPLSTYFNISSDVVFEIGLTPNRSDATSHIGVARDLVAVLNHTSEFKHLQAKLKMPSVANVKAEEGKKIHIEIENTEACPRYTGLTIENITVSESPDWLKQKLNCIGLRPINNLVDITNFILMETGQPLHAFDLNAIKGEKVLIKNLADETPFITLDGQERKLSAEDLMICNAEEAMCIAGVFGGLHSGITHESKGVFLESAYFSPQSIRRTSKRHGLKTDASFRFERGADPAVTVYAIKRAAQLIQEICGGTLTSEIEDVYPNPISLKQIEITYQHIYDLIGKDIEKETVKSILMALGICILKEAENGLLLEIPTYKTDVTRPADVIEEILRIYGYNNIELPDNLRVSASQSIFSIREQRVQQISDFLSANAFYEIINNPLTHSEHIAKLPNLNPENNVPILNPLSRELNVLRRTMLTGGLETIVYNLNRKSSNLKFYEFGKTYLFHPETEKGIDVTKRYAESFRLALFISGQMNEESWYKKEESAGFFDLKQFVHVILKRCGINPTSLKTETNTDAYFTESLLYFSKKKKLVELGQIHKDVLQYFDVKQAVFYADFDFDLLLQLAENHKTTFSEIPKYPEVRRDLALLVDTSISFEQIRKIATGLNNPKLRSVNLFDVYEGEKLPSGKKSYAVSFMLRDDQKTLQDSEIDAFMNKLIQTYTEQIQAVIR